MAIREIPVCDWKEVWEEYWIVERMNHLSERKKKRMKCAVREELVFDNEEIRWNTCLSGTSTVRIMRTTVR